MELGSTDGEDPTAIPAASIGGIDLNILYRLNPAAAKEIARIGDLMGRGEETDEEFLQLCQLLFDAGAVEDAEYLLRRNISYDGGLSLYERLFGDTKPTEFEKAIKAFQEQFEVRLENKRDRDFLDAEFFSPGATRVEGDFELLRKACDVTISYSDQFVVEADIVLHDPTREVFFEGEDLLLKFIEGKWELHD